MAAEPLRQSAGVAYRVNNVDALAHAMVALALDRPCVKRLATGARETAERLSWESELDRLDAAYREVCGFDVAPVEGELAAAGTAMA